MKKIGFIGAGNMATAIIKGISRSTLGAEIYAYDLDEKKLAVLYEYNVCAVKSVEELLSACDYLFLAVKPQNMPVVLKQLLGAISHDTVIVSIAAGITPAYITKELQFEAKVVQVMPNTPLMLSLGATAIARADTVSDDEFAFAKAIFDCAGITEVISLNKMNEIIPINGSSPAFIYKLAEGFIDYGKSVGIEEKVCLRLFAQSLIGSAKMLTQSGYSVEELITMVSSKGGTTIAGLAAMEENGFSRAIDAGCEACVKRAYELTIE